MARITQLTPTTFEIEPTAEFRAKGWPPAVIHATSRKAAIRHYKTTYSPR